MTEYALNSLDLKCFTTEKLESRIVEGNRTNGGTHSMIRLIPRSGSIAQMMAPNGILADAWNGVQARRISHCEVEDPDDSLNNHYVDLNLVPRFEGEEDVPYELLPFITGVVDEDETSMGCNISEETIPRSFSGMLASVVTGFYSLGQERFCRDGDREIMSSIMQRAREASVHHDDMASR